MEKEKLAIETSGVIGRIIGLIVGFALIKLVFAAPVTHSQTDLGVIQFVREINKTTPIQLDRSTRLDTATYSNSMLSYYHTFVNLPANRFTQDSKMKLSQALRQSITQRACSTPEARDLLKYGVQLDYLYYSNDGQFILDVMVKEKDCS